MKKIKNLVCVALVILSLSMLGAWAPTGVVPTENRYADAQMYSLYATETVSFDQKETDVKANSAPQYTVISGLTNACGAVAGSEIVAYYDKYYPNMIPGWESFFASSGKYRPRDKVYIPNLMTELYTLMKTNVAGPGVSESEFIDGLAQYITGKGYGMSMQSVLSGTTVNFDACKTAINNNKVIVLLSQPVDLYIMNEGTTEDSIVSSTVSDYHIMVASGYKEIKYYKGGTLFRTDRYLVVSTGLNAGGVASYKVNGHKLDSAYIVNIA